MDKTTVNAQLVTTELKRVFYHLKSVDCETSDLWKVFVWLCGSPLLKEANHYTFMTIPQEHWLIGMSMARPS